MASAGTFSIDFSVGGLAKVMADVDLLTRSLGGSMRDIEGAADLAKKGLVALTGAASIGGFALLIKGALDTAAALHDLSIKSGVSVESLSRWSDIGRLSATSVDMVAASSNKLSKAMAVASEDSKGAAQAIKALGLNFDEFQRMSPEQRMQAVAGAMDKFADGSGKTAAAMALFGKSGAELLPFMKDLATTGEIQARITTEQAAAADAFGDNLEKLTISGGAWRTELAAGMAPALAEASQAFLDVMNGSGGLRESLQELVRDGTIAEWTRGAVTGLTYVMDGFTGVWRLIQSVGEIMGAWAARIGSIFGTIGDAVGRLKSGDVKGALDAWNSGMERTRAIGADLDETLGKIWSEETVGQKLRARMEEVKGFGAASAAAKPQVDMRAQLSGNDEAAKKAANAYKSLVDSVGKYLTQTAAEIAQNKNLSEGQKLVLRLQELLDDTTLRMTEADRRYVSQLIEKVRATDDTRRAQEEATKAHDKAMETVRDSVRTLGQQIEAQQAANLKTAEGEKAVAALEIAKLRDAAATAERNAQLAGESKLNADLVAEYLAQADSLRKLADLKEEGTHLEMAKQARDEWKKTTDSIEQGLVDSLFRAAENGKGFFASMRDAVKGIFNNLVLRPIIQAVMAPVAGALGSILGTSALGGGTLSGAGSLLGSLGNIASLGKSLLNGSLFTSLAGNVGMGITSIGQSLGSLGMQNFGNDMALGINGTAGGMVGSALSSIGGGFTGAMLGNLVSGGYGKKGYVNAGAAIGSIFGPVGGIVGGIIGGVVNRLFGMGPKKYGASGVEGDLIAGDFSGRTFADWTQKGGLFRKNRRGTDYGDVPQEMADALDAGGAAVYAQVQAYADMLKLPADALKDITYKLRVTLTDDEKKNTEAITAALNEYEDTLAARFADAVAPFQQAGETVVETLGRLAQIQTFSESINEFGGVFSRVATLSVSAKEELLGFAGGMESFVAKTQSFVEAYYSDAEKYGLAAKQVQEQLRAIGITADISSRADFRSLVEGTDLSTSEGRKRLNDLLDIAQAFAPIGQYLEQNGGSLADLAGQAPQSALLESVLADQEAQAAYQEKLTGQVDQLNGSILSIGEQISAAIASGNADLLAALVAIARSTTDTSRLLETWDDGGAMLTTPAT